MRPLSDSPAGTGEEMRQTDETLIAALQRLVIHDLAADSREGLHNCAELESACDLLDESGKFPEGYRHLWP
jgi:hypothetical protein